MWLGLLNHYPLPMPLPYICYNDPMTPVSHHPPVASTPEGATPATLAALRGEVDRAFAHARTTGNWEPYTHACRAFFFARLYSMYDRMFDDLW